MATNGSAHGLPRQPEAIFSVALFFSPASGRDGESASLAKLLLWGMALVNHTAKEKPMTSNQPATFDAPPAALDSARPTSGAGHRRLHWIVRWLSSACLLLWIASPLAAENRFYVDLKDGRADFERGVSHPGHPWDFDDEAASLAVALGVDLHPNLAVEVGFQAAHGLEGRGSACFPSSGVRCIELIAYVEADLDLWTLAIVPKRRFGRFTILGRIGAVYYEQDITAMEPLGYLGRLTDTELLLGAGARLDLTPRVELLIEYDRIEVGLKTLSLGLGYRF